MRSQKAPPGIRERGGKRGVLVLVVVGVAWGYACNWALNPLRGQLESRMIARTEERLTAGADNVAEFVEESERAIHSHSPGDAELCARLADLATTGAATTTDPVKKLNLTDKALSLRKEAALLEPVNAYRPFEMAMDYVRLGRPALALLQADRACGLLPNDPWIRAYLAEDFAAHGQRELARRYLRKAERLAAERGIDEAMPAIETARKALELATAP